MPPETRIQLLRPSGMTEIDHCDDCGRKMPLTGDSLCNVCEEIDRGRFECPNCGHSPVMYLVRESRPDFCSDACEDAYWSLDVG